MEAESRTMASVEMDDAVNALSEEQVMQASEGAAPGGGLRKRAGQGSADLDDRDLGGVAGGALKRPDDRLIEYTITLTYRTDDYRQARQDLIELAGRYGYLQNSSAYTDPTWNMNTNMRVRAEDMYTALKELDQLGRLEGESIQSTDHTESMVLAERQFRREQIRLTRRSQAANRTPAANKNWAEREQLIEQSETRQDQAAHEQWKIEDRVRYAEIRVHLLGPDVPIAVEVPAYRNAFTLLVNWFLELLYGAIVASPLLAILLLLWLKRARIQRVLGIAPKEKS